MDIEITPCEHQNFQVNANIGRLTDGDNGPVTSYVAEIHIYCADCKLEFEFVGLPLGMSGYRPTVSFDGLELRAPITPKGTKPPENLAGFAVTISETEQ